MSAKGIAFKYSNVVAEIWSVNRPENAIVQVLPIKDILYIQTIQPSILYFRLAIDFRRTLADKDALL